MSTPAAPAPPTRLLLELPTSPAGVERDLETLPHPVAVPWWREHGWLVPAGVAVLGLVYQWVAGTQDWTVPGWVPVATTVMVALTAVASLITYSTQLRTRRVQRGRAALLADPVRTTGTLRLTAEPAVTRGGVVLSGSCTYTRVPDGGVPLVRTVRFTHTAHGADGAAVVDALPRRRVIEPVAVWYAARPDSVDVVLVRYARRWADEVLAAVDDTEALDAPASPDDDTPV